jgi:membrane-bound serine protease (ClpP class)
MRIGRRILPVAFLLLGTASLALGASPYIARVEMTGVIDQVQAAFIEEALAAAADGGATAVLIEIDSPGGELTSKDRIVKAILASPIPVLTWVTPSGGRAASAATFVTLAGDVAAMAPATTIGAASVVGSGGEELPETIGRKITNDLVAQIRQLAEAHGRNADWAESAVRDAVSAGAEDAAAMDPPVVDLVAETYEELIAAADSGVRADGYAYHHDGQPLPELGGLEVRDLTMNIGQQFLHLLSDPNIAFLLFTIGFYGIVAELYHPNYVTGTVGAIAIVLAVIGSNSLPLNIGGLLLILIGIGLFILEVHVTSYGFLAIGGAIAVALGAFALYTGVDGTDAIQVEVSPWLVGMVVGFALLYLALVLLGMVQVRRIASPTDPMRRLIGAHGQAQTMLAPTGTALAGGESWSARSQSGPIRPGTALRVVGVKGLELQVEPQAAPDAGDASVKTEDGED